MWGEGVSVGGKMEDGSAGVGSGRVEGIDEGGDTYEEEGSLGGVDVGEDFEALLLVGGDELVERIVGLAEVSAVSLAATLHLSTPTKFSTLKSRRVLAW